MPSRTEHPLAAPAVRAPLPCHACLFWKVKLCLGMPCSLCLFQTYACSAIRGSSSHCLHSRFFVRFVKSCPGIAPAAFRPSTGRCPHPDGRQPAVLPSHPPPCSGCPACMLRCAVTPVCTCAAFFPFPYLPRPPRRHAAVRCQPPPAADPEWWAAWGGP